MAGGIGDFAGDLYNLPMQSVTFDPNAGVAGIDASFGGATIPSLSASPAPFSSDPAPQSAPQSSGPSYNFSPQVEDAIAQASQKTGVPLDYLRRVAWIESKGDPNAVSSTGATGVFQFTKGTAKAMGLGDRTDPYANALAAAQYAQQNQSVLRDALGRDPTHGELYLAHQQGGAGARGILSNPNALASDTVGSRAIVVNGGNPAMTNQQFAGLWTSKFPGGTQTQAQAPTAPAPAAATPGYAAPATGVGSTATGGTFGVSGIQARGAPQVGQASAPSVPSLGAQPMTAMAPTAQTMMGGAPAAPPSDPQSLLQKLMGNNSLSSLTGGIGKAAGQQGQQKQAGGGMQHAPAFKPSGIGLQQAQSMFNPGRFYQMLNNANILTGKPMTPGGQ